MNANESRFPVHGAGLGLRRGFMQELATEAFADFPDFLEIAPENWMGMGGRYARSLRRFTERHPFVCHGLSLSIGGPLPLDMTFLTDLRRFLDMHQVRVYSEHLSYTTDDGQLYDLWIENDEEGMSQRRYGNAIEYTFWGVMPPAP